jgi:hypothetical protein
MGTGRALEVLGDCPEFKEETGRPGPRRAPRRSSCSVREDEQVSEEHAPGRERQDEGAHDPRVRVLLAPENDARARDDVIVMVRVNGLGNGVMGSHGPILLDRLRDLSSWGRTHDELHQRYQAGPAGQPRRTARFSGPGRATRQRAGV